MQAANVTQPIEQTVSLAIYLLQVTVEVNFEAEELIPAQRVILWRWETSHRAVVDLPAFEVAIELALGRIAQLEKLRLVIKFFPLDFRVYPDGRVQAELDVFYLGAPDYRRVAVLTTVELLIVVVDKDVRRAKILLLLVQVGYALFGWAVVRCLKSIHRMHVVARPDNELQALVVRHGLASIQCHRVVPVDAVEVTLFILLHLSQNLLILQINGVKLGVILFCARPVIQKALRLYAVFEIHLSDGPSHVPRVIHRFLLEILLQCEGDPKIGGVQVQNVVWLVVLLDDFVDVGIGPRL